MERILPSDCAGYTFQGASSGTATFAGTYNYYIIITTYPGNIALIDALQGSNNAHPGGFQPEYYDRQDGNGGSQTTPTPMLAVNSVVGLDDFWFGTRADRR